MIAEMGVTGGVEHQRDWFIEMVEVLGSYPQLRTVVYFQANDTPGVWGDLATPDWRISPELFLKQNEP